MGLLSRFSKSNKEEVPKPPVRTDAGETARSSKREEERDFLLHDIEMMYFPTERDICKHILADINANLPDRVLITISRTDFTHPFEANVPRLKEEYDSWTNQFSLTGLCRKVEECRGLTKKVIILSNYPRETDPPSVTFFQNGVTPRTVTMPVGTSLRLCDKSDASKKIAVYLMGGAYTTGYIRDVYRSQVGDQKGNLRLQVLVSGGSDRGITYSERQQLDACSDNMERHRLLAEIAEKLEIDPTTPITARKGNILMD